MRTSSLYQYVDVLTGVAPVLTRLSNALFDAPVNTFVSVTYRITLYKNKPVLFQAQVCFFDLVEVVRVELTSYAAAKKLSTYLVYLLFLKSATRLNTLCVPQEAK